MADIYLHSGGPRHPSYDDVQGLCVGGNYVAWQLFYADRPQSQRQYSDTESEAIAAAEMRVSELKRDYKWICYPDDSQWTVRIYG